jgi:hypothetical protein
VSAGDAKEVTVTVEHARNLFGPITGEGGKKFLPPQGEPEGAITPRSEPKTGEQSGGQ